MIGHLLFSQNDSSIAVFSNRSPWAAFEEEALLDAVEQYSIGNWLAEYLMLLIMSCFICASWTVWCPNVDVVTGFTSFSAWHELATCEVMHLYKMVPDCFLHHITWWLTFRVCSWWYAMAVQFPYLLVNYLLLNISLLYFSLSCLLNFLVKALSPYLSLQCFSFLRNSNIIPFVILCYCSLTFEKK